MRWVKRHNTTTPLLAWCLAATFLFAQTLASVHSHDDSDQTDHRSECEICIVGSQLDDLDVATVDPFFVASTSFSLGCSFENQIAQLTPADANVRAPPVS